MIFAVSQYQKTYDFPNHFCDPKKKEEPDWNREFCEALYSLYLRDMTALPYSRRNDMINFRLYSEGRQTTTKYMDYLCPEDPITRKRTGYMNISWDSLAILPKFKRIFLGMLENTDFNVRATAIDDKSDEEKNNAKFNAWAIAQLRPLFKDMEQMGIKTPEPPLGFDPQTKEELELMMTIGGMKLKKEISIEKALQYGFYESRWSPQVTQRVRDDWFTLAIACVRDYVDPITKRVKARYADPINCIIRYSSDPCLKEGVDMAGEVRLYTITEIKKVAGLNDEQLQEIARMYKDYNKTYWNINTHYQQRFGNEEFRNFDSMIIPVLEADYFSWDTEFSEKKVNKYGRERIYEKDWEYGVSHTGKTGATEVKMLYGCKWIIGTPYVWDYGKQHDIPRKDYREPQLPWHFYKFDEKSMVESAIPFVDNFHKNWYEWQNAQAAAAPPGLAVNVSALKNINIGTKTIGPLEVLAIRKRTGDLLYRATTHSSQIIPAGIGSPVTPLEGGTGGYGLELIQNMDYNLQHIRNIVGIPEVVDASTPHPEQPVGTTKISFNQTMQSLKGYVIAYKSLKESVARNFFYRLKVLTNYGDYKFYLPALGGTNMEIIKLGKEFSDVDCGIMLEMSATEEEKQIIMKAALDAMRPLKQGGANLTFGNFLYIIKTLGKDQIDYAMAYINYVEQKNKEIQMQQDQMNVKMNEESNAEAVKIKTKLEGDKIRMETDEQIRLEREKSMIRVAEKHATSPLEMEKILEQLRSKERTQQMKNESSERMKPVSA